MPRIMYHSVLLALVVAVFAATPAAAAQRYAKPGGTGLIASCLVSNPCSIADAVNSGYATGGDEVILAPGDYNTGSTELDIMSGIDVHGQGTPSQTRIVSTTTSSAVYMANAGAKLRNVEVDDSGVLGVAAFASSGTIDGVIARSDAGSGCEASNATIRDSICASHGSNGAGINLNWSDVLTHSIILRNVTAIGTGAANSYGISAGESTAATVSINAKGVIARGTTRDVKAFVSGGSSTITLDHSNYQTVSTVGGAGATVTSTALNSNQTAAPLFVNAAAGDFHQAIGSPTIDAGAVDGSSGTTDVDGEARVQGLAADIGADEFTVAPVAPPPLHGSTPADTTAPQTKIGKHPKHKTTKRKAKFTFSSSEANSTFKCKLDKHAFVPCKSPFVKKVKPGKHTFRVVATDAAGNADRTPAVYKWRVLAG